MRTSTPPQGAPYLGLITADHGQQPGVLSPWIDANFAPIEDYLRQVDAQELAKANFPNGDLRGAIATIAGATGIPITDAQLDEFTEAASFDHMKSRAVQFAPESGTGLWKTESNFFASGRSGQWEDKLTADELAAFEVRLGELLTADEARWMLNGNGS